MSQGGIPIVEIAVTVPDAALVIADLVKNAPDVIVGAGSVSDVETARRCFDAGAKFLTSDGLDPETVNFAVQQGVVALMSPSQYLKMTLFAPKSRRKCPSVDTEQ